MKAQSDPSDRLDREGRITRRELLKGVAGLGALAAVNGCSHVGTHPTMRIEKQFPLGDADAIRRENEKAGTREWLLTSTRIDPATRYRCPWIEGYCSRTSVRNGEKLKIYVSTNPASPFSIEIYRLGYYGGAGGRHMKSLGPFRGETQPDPPIGDKRVRDC